MKSKSFFENKTSFERVNKLNIFLKFEDNLVWTIWPSRLPLGNQYHLNTITNLQKKLICVESNLVHFPFMQCPLRLVHTERVIRSSIGQFLRTRKTWSVRKFSFLLRKRMRFTQV